MCKSVSCAQLYKMRVGAMDCLLHFYVCFINCELFCAIILANLVPGLCISLKSSAKAHKVLVKCRPIHTLHQKCSLL